MNILVINGDCVQTNTSANLCHLAYIHGLLDAGHQVTLLSANAKGYPIDRDMTIPATVTHYTYNGISLYQKLSWRNKCSTTATTAALESPNKIHSVRKKLILKIKFFIRSLYGVHGIYSTFVRKAIHFRSECHYDYVLSISTPVTSHLLAYKLLHSNHIKADHWIQIWEDPWYSDAYGFNGKEEIRQEEQRLLSFAEKVCYVSPLTLQNQQLLFPESAHKMFWQPLPCYYKERAPILNLRKLVYGYFGDYAPAARNLEPFYSAAKSCGIEVNICGNPDSLFPSTQDIHIYPRLPLSKLSPIEDKTNVLIFLCNRKGGQIPGKIYQYSATSKTILFILDGTEEEQRILRDYFSKFNRYIFCQNTEKDISRAIRQIESGNLGGIQNTPLECFNPVTIISNILSLGGQMK